jgi:hypothetical protein
MKRSGLILGAVLLMSVVATRSWASSPSDLTVTETDSSITWAGETYSNAVVESPDSCPASSDTANLLCDHVSLSIQQAPHHREEQPPLLTLSIAWDDPSNDFDLYFYQDDQLLAESAQQQTSSEVISVSVPLGEYEIRVVPRSVLESGYSGMVTLAPAPASPAPGPSPSGSPSPSVSPSPIVSPELVASGQATGTPPPDAVAETDTTTPASRPNPTVGRTLPSTPSWASGAVDNPYRAKGIFSLDPTSTSVHRSVMFQATAASPAVSGKSTQPEQPARMTAVSRSIPATPPMVWLLLMPLIGLVLLPLVTYLVLEPDSEMNLGQAGEGMAAQSQKSV